MTKIFVESPLRVLSRFEPANEGDFESQVLRCAKPLFPDYVAGPWKPRVRDVYGHAAHPDAVLVAPELSLWYVVEVELVSHSVSRHVRPQLETLGRGIYDSTLVPSLRRAVPEVPEEVLEDLIYKEPGLLCIADGFSESLRSACLDNGFELCVLEPHRDDLGGWALNASHLASPMRSLVSINRYQLRRGRVTGDREFLELPSHFPIVTGTVSVVDVEDEVHECRIYRSDSVTYLLMPSNLAGQGRSLSLLIIDRSQRKFRLEVT